MKPVPENESRHLGQNEMAGLKGKSGPPGNMNAFKHGLAAIKAAPESITAEHGEPTRQQILDGLLADNGAITSAIYKYICIIFKEPLFGRALPCSHFRSVVGSTPSRSANAFWVSPSVLRAARNLSAQRYWVW
jgi:hypothetical protein